MSRAKETNRHDEEPRVHPRLIDHLVRHPLRGNVFELGQLLWRALRASPGEEVGWGCRIRSSRGANPAPLRSDERWCPLSRDTPFAD